MVRSMTDAQLVQAASGGDSAAFGDLYDRYTDRVHTFAYARLRDPADAADALQQIFITAHRRLDQLQDPARFRPWLFAIARTTVIDVARDRTRRAAASIDQDGAPEVVADIRAPGRDLEAEESGALLWQAATGLQPRDQELLELHLREGLEGAELAEAMNVEPSHVYVMVKRLKERLGTAVGSLLVARRGREDCVDLQGVLAGWDGTFSLDVRSKVTRHIESCETCQETRRGAIAWETIASAMPSVPAPVGTKAAILAEIGVTGTTAGGGVSGVSSGVLTGVSVFASIATTIGVLAAPVLLDDPQPSTVETAAIVIADDEDEATTTTTPTEVAGVIEVTTTTTSTTTTTTVAPTTATTTTTTTVAPAPATTVAPPPATTTTAAPTTTTIALPTTISPAPPQTPPTTIAVGPPPTTAAHTTTTTTTTTTNTTTTTTTTTVAPLPGELNVSVPGLDFGPIDEALPVTVENGGDGPLTWSAVLDPASAGFGLAGTTSGVLLPGESAVITVTFDRTVTTAEGDYAGSLDVTSDGGDESVPLTAVVDNPPLVDVNITLPIFEDGGACAGGQAGLPVSAPILATIADESPLSQVDLVIDGNAEPILPDPNDPSGTQWIATLGPGLPAGSIDVAVSATDDRGAETTTLVTVEVTACPG